MERWEGAVEDISLFQFYKKIEEKVKMLRNEAWGEEIDTQNDNHSFATTYVNNEQPTATTSQEKSPIKIISNVLIRRSNETNVPFPSEHTSEEPSTSQEKTPVKLISDNLVQNIGEDKTIPSPFKRALIWPEPKPAKKRASKEKIPSVVTSKAWQEYHESKERKKKEEEE